jgi:hypothetical protein
MRIERKSRSRLRRKRDAAVVSVTNGIPILIAVQAERRTFLRGVKMV